MYVKYPTYGGYCLNISSFFRNDACSTLVRHTPFVPTLSKTMAQHCQDCGKPLPMFGQESAKVVALIVE